MSFSRPSYPEKLVRPTLLALTTLVKLPERASVTFSSARRTENQISLSLFFLASQGTVKVRCKLSHFSACRSQHLAVATLRFHLNRASIGSPPIEEGKLSISLFVPFRAVFGKTISRWFLNRFVKMPELMRKYTAPTWREVRLRHVTGRCQWPFYQ